MRLFEMNLNRYIQILILSFFYVVSAQASLVAIEVIDDVMLVGEQIQVAVNIDFSGENDESIGGTFQLNYNDLILTNPVFEFETDVVLSSYGIQSEYNKVGSDAAGKLNITFGTLDFYTGVTGVGRLGSLYFDAIAKGKAELSLIDYKGGFLDSVSFLKKTIQYQGTEVNVVKAVPLPASIMMFLTGLSVLTARRKRNW